MPHRKVDTDSSTRTTTSPSENDTKSEKQPKAEDRKEQELKWKYEPVKSSKPPIARTPKDIQKMMEECQLKADQQKIDEEKLKLEQEMKQFLNYQRVKKFKEQAKSGMPAKAYSTTT